MAKEIGDILERKPSEAKPQESKPEQKVEAKEPKPTIPSDKNEAKPKDDKQGQTKAPDTDGVEQIKNEVDPAKRAAGFEGAYKSEKTKRKEAQTEIERWKAEAEKYRKVSEDNELAWKKRLDMLQPQRPPEPPKPRANLFENPEQWEQQQQADIQSAVSGLRFQYSEEFARHKYGPEFDEAAKAAEAAFSANPNHSLARTLRESQNPGEDLVQWFRKETVFSKTGGNLDEFRKKSLEEMLADPKQREELISKLGLKSSEEKPGEQQQEPKPQTPAPHELPTNLAGARNVSGRSGPVWTGPKSLNELIPSGTRKR